MEDHVKISPFLTANKLVVDVLLCNRMGEHKHLTKQFLR